MTATGTSRDAGDVQELLDARLLLDSVQDYAIFQLDREGHVRTWNRGAERITGWLANEVIGKHISTFYREEDRKAGMPERELAVALAEGRYEEDAIRVRKDGTTYYANVVVTPLLDDLGTHRGFAKVTRDVTESRRARESLLQSEERFRLMIEAVRDYAIFMLDPTGVITTWNSGAERLKGYRAAEIVGAHFSRFYTADDIAEGKPARELLTASEQGRYEEEGWRLRKDGTRFWANVVISAVRDARGVLLGFAKVTRDMTERRAVLQDLERNVADRTAELTAANEEMRSFSYSVSHDLRAPLRSVEGFATLLLESADSLDAKQKDYLTRIRVAAQRMSDLIDGLLRLSRLSRAVLIRERVDVTAIAKAVLQELAHSDPTRVVTTRVDADMVLDADRSLVRVVVDNLVRNAWKFTRGKERALIEVTVSAHVLHVRDDGVGFDPALTGKLFTPFQRLHPAREFEGTGIGLALVQRIALLHGGRAWAEGQRGAGASFHVAFGKS